MKKLEKIILVLIFIVIVVIITILILFMNKQKLIENYNMKIGDAGMEVQYNEDVAEEVMSNIDYYSVIRCIYRYLDLTNIDNSIYFGYDSNNEYTKIMSDEEINIQILDLLDNEYIETNNINVQNLREYINIIKEKLIFVPLEMRVLKNEKIYKYIVYGFTEDLNYNFVEYQYFIVNVDISNNTFSIVPLLQKYNNLDEINIKNEKKEDILKNDYNEYNREKVNYEYVAKEYLNFYKRTAIANPKVLYNYLNEEYKAKRFGNEENFIKYINSNKELISKITLKKYQVNQVGEDTQYICIDQYDNYYIFYEKFIMKVNMILDTYTIDLPEFLEQYNSTNNQGKTALNIQKFIQSINAKDYSYAYSKLADSFKNNYFKTEEDFEKYVKDTFFEVNKAEYGEFSVEGNVNTYEITLSDQTGENTNKLTFNIIMQLQEGTDFVMSFGT